MLNRTTAAIDRLYPEGDVPDQMEREAAEQEAYAARLSRVYIGREEYYQRLDKYAVSEDLPLIVCGELGSGKSALLANWTLRYRSEHPQDLLLMQSVGATPAWGVS